MSGIALTIRKNNRISTRKVEKGASRSVVKEGFFKETDNIWEEWGRKRPTQFAPYDYGLIVVDFDQKWIGAYQGNTLLDRWSGPFHNSDFYEKNSPSLQELKELWEAGRVDQITNPKAQPYFEKLKGLSFNEMIENLQGFVNNPKIGLVQLDFYISPPKGWTMREYEPDEYAVFLNDLAARQFKFKPQDFKKWREYLEESAADDTTGLDRFVHQQNVEKDKKIIDQATPLIQASSLRKYRL